MDAFTKESFSSLFFHFACADTSTTAPPVFWRKKGFISFTTGLMTEHGIHWAELLEARFTQVSNSYSAQLDFIWFVLNAGYINDT